MSALPPKADKERTCRDVGFVTKADICAMAPRSVLTAKVLGYNEGAANFAFTDQRKAVLDALREELRKQNYLPILFDFDVPATRDITETVSLLARMSRLIIADLTDPSSIPKELEAIVPGLAVPVQPLLEGSSRPYAMFKDYWKYEWVLPVYRLFVFRKRALYEQVGFDWRSTSWHTPQEIAAARLDALLTYDAGERLRSIRNPTLLIAAADDLLVPWQLSELIAEEIAHACLVKLDHGGHHFPQTRVEAYNALLLEFFRTHSESDATPERPRPASLQASNSRRS